MAPSKKSTYTAEVSLAPELRSCLVNIPSPLTSVLNDGGYKVQDCVIDIAWNAPPDKKDGKPKRKSVFAGWSGLPSRKKEAALNSRGQPGKDVQLLEMDSAFARINGIQDGQKVCAYFDGHSGPGTD